MAPKPLSTDTLYDQAEALLENIRDDTTFEHFLNFYYDNREIALADPDGRWANLMAIALGRTDHRYQDDERAHAFLMLAARRGNVSAHYNIGIGWRNGRFGRVDVARGMRWLDKVSDLHPTASAVVAVYMMGDERYITDAAFTAAVHQRLQKSADQGAPFAMLSLANLHTSGLLGKRDPIRAMALYSTLASFPALVPPRVAGAYQGAVRCYLGLDIPEDSRAALAYLDRVQANPISANITYVMANDADRLRYLIDHPNAERANARKLVRSLYNGEHKDTPLDQFLADLSPEAASVLGEVVLLCSDLANNEWWPTSDYWNSLLRLVQARALAVPYSVITNSDADLGLTYNDASPRGREKPGCYRTSDARTTGFGAFKGFAAQAHGEVEFFFGPQVSGRPPLLVQEDIDVAMALAFGSQQPIWPEFSIEPLTVRTAEQPRWVYREKIWTPSWLAYTLMGRTLYAADRLLGQIAFSPDSFSAEANDGPRPDAAAFRAASRLLTTLRTLGGREAGLTKRVMIKPTEFARSWKVETSGAQFCFVHKLSMGIDGSAIDISPDGTEDRRLHLNDLRFSGGRLGAVLTEHYDLLAELWPVFERARQLTALMKSLHELRRRDYTPSPPLRSRIDSTYNSFTSRPVLRREERLTF